jgi:PAS domain S-box-containing protein
MSDGHDQHTATKKALREQEDIFRLLVETVRDYAIFLLDPEGYVSSWNAGAAAFKGYSAEEIIGQPLERFYTQEDARAGKPRRLLRRAEADGRVEDEGWRVRKDGSKFWADVVITALHNDHGQLVGYAKVTRDLTERREAEEAIRRANSVLEQRVMERTTALEQVNASLHEKNQELEAFMEVTVGRELKMMELEKENAELRSRLEKNAKAS